MIIRFYHPDFESICILIHIAVHIFVHRDRDKFENFVPPERLATFPKREKWGLLNAEQDLRNSPRLCSSPQRRTSSCIPNKKPMQRLILKKFP